MVRPSLIDRIKTSQVNDPYLQKIRTVVENRAQKEVNIHDDGSLRYGNRLYVPNMPHCTRYRIHPGGTKMYKDLKETFWWNNMKREIAQYVA